MGDGNKDVTGRAMQEAKTEGWGEGALDDTLILTFSQREKGFNS
jgi:hypothetical protein